MNEDLSKFTDVIDEICNSQPFEVCDSQPLSLSSSSNTPIHQGDPDPLPQSHRPPKCTGQRGNFRCVEEIDPKYRHIFSYRYFNLVQSSVIEDALYSNKSIVVSAPTGSGKTVVFEMAIVQLLMELEDRNYAGDFKIIYMAPIKALCTERLTEWYSKFTKLGLLCIEVTGDTDVEFPQLQPYRIIITTPEKWDMLTRRWKDHRGLVEVVKLFLIDEVHILNDEMRGPVLEAVVSRMKTIETSVQSAHRIEKLQAQAQGADPQRRELPPRIRFVAVSATVSNPEDVAAWLGNSENPAAYYKFGDECRPVKLNRVVEAYPCPPGTSIFKFDITLNYKLWPVIRKYQNGKPTLIFCNTRKGVILTAETLSREITVTFSQGQKDILAALASTIKNKKVQSLILCGVGCHHAGLLYEERSNIEQAFRNRDLPILITTTTLAMGVNLPAHLVIIKNTQQYVNGAYQEYSISTVLQMVGRAGRPQYDTEATAVIMTRLQDKARYQALVGGCEPLQSYLHKRLAENLNSEAALGTVCDVAQCVQWVNSTFLSVRAARDPRRYLSLPPAAPAELITQKIEELCVRAMNGLASAGLITMDELSCIESTEAGRLMSLYYLDLETMKLIMKLEGTESLEQLLWLVCESHELADMHLRVDERRCLNALNRNNAAATIRFPMKGKINSRQMKLSCIIQAVLGCLPIPDPSLNQEAMKIIRTADRVCKCIVSYVTRHSLISQNPKFYAAVLNSLILAKCISSQLWENSPYVSRQLKGIGPAYSALLASAGKTNFMVLEESHPRDLERIMNKGPPAGNILRKQISLLPKYNLTMTPVSERVVRIQLTLINQAYLAENLADLTAGINHKSYVIVGDSENDILYFSTFKESDLISVYDGCMTFEVTRKHANEHKVIAHCISSTFVGIDEKCEYVFMDINPTPEVNSDNHQNLTATEKLETRSPTVQTAITDVFKDRKRKLIDKNDPTQSKEKKKRDNNLLESFKSLKESLKKTADEIKIDVNKKSNVSQVQNMNLPLINTAILPNHDHQENQYQENGSTEDIELEDIDDEQFEDILSKIESEIKDTNHCKFVILETKPNIQSNQLTQFHKNKPIKYNYNNRHTESFKNINKRNRSKINTTNNFTFLDMLERKDSNEDNDNTVTENETNFSEAVKSQIEKFLQQAPEKFSTNISNIGVMDSLNVIDKHSEETIDLTNYVASQNTDVTNNNDLVFVTDEISINLNTEKEQFPKTIESFHSPFCDDETPSASKLLPVQPNMKYKSDNEATNIAEENEFHHAEEGLDSVINNNMTKESTKLSPNQTNRKHLDNKDSKSETNKTTNCHEIKLGELLKASGDNTIYNELNKNNQYSLTSYHPLHTNIISQDLPFLVCRNNETPVLRPVNRQYDHFEEELGSETNSCFKNHEESPIPEENVEKINKYSFGQTKMFNVCTKNTSQQKVQIISKVHVDLDVTEIVYKKDEQSLISRFGSEIPRFDDNINFDTMDTLNCRKGVSNNKVNSPDKLAKKFILHPCWSTQAKINLLKSEPNKAVELNCNFNEIGGKMIARQNKTPLKNEDNSDSYAILSRNTSQYYNLENSYLKDVLQNHRNMLTRQKNIYESKAINSRGKYETQNSKLVISKTYSRMNKTRHIQEKTQIPLHQLFSIEEQNTACEKAITQHRNFTENIKNQNRKIEENIGEQNIIQIMNYSESESPHLDSNKNITEICPQMPALSDILYNINDCTNNGSYQGGDLLIPPPPEFCDDERHSTTITNEDDKLEPENEHSLKINHTDVKVGPDLFKKAQERIKGQDENRTSNTNQNELTKQNEDVLQTNKSNASLPKDTITRSTSVKDILHKYSNIFNKQETKEIGTDSRETKNALKIIQNNDIQDTEYTDTNYRRKYKIKDIPPPQSLPVGSLATLPQKRLTQQNNLTEAIIYKKRSEIQNNRNIIDDNSYKTQKNNYINNTELVKEGIPLQMPESCIKIEDEIEDEAPEILQPDVLQSQVNLADDYDLNQALFNPKTLLERMNKDDEEITPGPSEFCNYNTMTYSPIYSNKYTENQNTEAIFQDHDELDQKAEEFTQNFEDLQNDSSDYNNVFENDSVVNLTPSKEVETWTLSQENAENRSFNFVTDTSSFTTLRNNRTEDKFPKYSFSHNNARQAKLSYFKFERKRRFYDKI